MSDTPDQCFDDGCLDDGWLVVGAESFRFSSVDVSPLGCRFSNLPLWKPRGLVFTPAGLVNKLLLMRLSLFVVDWKGG